MEKTYGSLKELEKTFGRTNNMVMYVDLENWKYYLKNPNEKIERGRTIFTEDLTIGELEMKLLSFIKQEDPKSIRELADLVHKNIATVQPKIKKMEEEGLISLEDE